MVPWVIREISPERTESGMVDRNAPFGEVAEANGFGLREVAPGGAVVDGQVADERVHELVAPLA